MRADEGFGMTGGEFPWYGKFKRGCKAGARKTAYDGKTDPQPVQSIALESAYPPSRDVFRLARAVPRRCGNTGRIPCVRPRNHIYSTQPGAPSCLLLCACDSPNTTLASSTVRANTPTQSNESAYETTPCRLTRP